MRALSAEERRRRARARSRANTILRRELVDRSVSNGRGSGPSKRERTLLGLNLLAAVAVPGVRYSQEEIAAWCGCSASAIYLAEQKALRKLRNRVQFLKDPVLRDVCLAAAGGMR